MKLNVRISKEEVSEQANAIIATIRAKPSDDYLAALVLEEMERAMNHAFQSGRVYERRNPPTP